MTRKLETARRAAIREFGPVPGLLLATTAGELFAVIARLRQAA